MRLCFSIVIIVIVFFLGGTASAGVFNTATVLPGGDFSLNFEEQFTPDADDYTFFFHLGMGLASQVADMSLTYGISSSSSDDYLGIDFEFVLHKRGPALSLTIGAHEFGNSGIDLALLMSGQLGDSSVRLYTGIDSDYEMKANDDELYANFVFGMEIYFRPEGSFIIEKGIEAVNEGNGNIGYFSLGIVLYY